ncbi:MAG: aspartate carbamoyltransferase regulatory subunit [Calditrichaceae bacterium]|nr:aspartate carbamoyltransferase regulatory subunit [Calditrichaceae bacterium]RQV96696.1 MAG: aspartate carbamoyltransferase regulatory subunit [Calditrichota bacterium]
MNNQENVLYIPKIELGIVIDHIPAGKGLKILDIISRYEEMKDVVVTLGQNYYSKKLGKKDLIKLQMEYLAPEIIQHISIVAPGVTIKAIKDFKVHNKVVVHPPKEIRNLLECKNPKCITNQEKHIGTKFTAVDDTIKEVKCNYCERVFKLSELDVINR